MIRKENQTLTIAEHKELARLIEENYDYSKFVDVLKSIENKQHGSFKSSINEASEKSFHEVMKKINAHNANKREKKRRLSILLVAASVICIFIAVTWIAPILFNNPSTNKAYVTKKGSKSSLILPDGTKIWMNSDSKISYGKNYGKKYREVSLQGEAYFEVVRDTSRPFMVHTASMDIKVLGTTFNVKAYPEEEHTEASLIKGSIEVILKNDYSKTIILKPNEKLSVKNAFEKHEHNKNMAVNKNDSEILMLNVMQLQDSAIVETLWMNNELVFNDETLENVALLLERWYGVDITISDFDLKENSFSGTFKNDNITEVLDALAMAGDFNYQKKNDMVLIYP